MNAIKKDNKRIALVVQLLVGAVVFLCLDYFLSERTHFFTARSIIMCAAALLVFFLVEYTRMRKKGTA